MINSRQLQESPWQASQLKNCPNSSERLPPTSLQHARETWTLNHGIWIISFHRDGRGRDSLLTLKPFLLSFAVDCCSYPFCLVSLLFVSLMFFLCDIVVERCLDSCSRVTLLFETTRWLVKWGVICYTTTDEEPHVICEHVRQVHPLYFKSATVRKMLLSRQLCMRVGLFLKCSSSSYREKELRDKDWVLFIVRPHDLGLQPMRERKYGYLPKLCDNSDVCVLAGNAWRHSVSQRSFDDPDSVDSVGHLCTRKQQYWRICCYAPQILCVRWTRSTACGYSCRKGSLVPKWIWTLFDHHCWCSFWTWSHSPAVSASGLIRLEHSDLPTLRTCVFFIGDVDRYAPDEGRFDVTSQTSEGDLGRSAVFLPHSHTLSRSSSPTL